MKIARIFLLLFFFVLPPSGAGSMDFSSASSSKMNCGSGTSLDNLDDATYMAWIYPNDLSPPSTYGIAWKGLFNSGYRIFGILTSEVTLSVERVTTELQATGSTTGLAGLKWNFVAAVSNPSGANSDQKVFIGDLRTEAIEATTYGVQDVGSGATKDNSAKDQIIGNRENNSREFNGLIAWVGIWNRAMTLQEIRSHQFMPRQSTGNVLFIFPGRHTGTGNQPDHSGNINHCTPSGTSQGLPVPLRLGG